MLFRSNTIEKTADNSGGDTLGEDLHIVEFVDLPSTHGVVAESAHSPAERATLLEEFGMVSGFTLSHEFFVAGLGGFSSDKVLFFFLGGVGG